MDRAAKVKVPGAARSFFYHLNSHLRGKDGWFWPHENVSQLFSFPGSSSQKGFMSDVCQCFTGLMPDSFKLPQFQLINDH